MDFIEIILILESIRNRGQNIYLISKGIKEQKKKGVINWKKLHVDLCYSDFSLGEGQLE